jgi:RNA polymerase sigma factor (sigma-70 family)
VSALVTRPVGGGRYEDEQVTAELLARARAGDGAAFGQLVEPHRRELQVHCYRVLGSLADAEDLLQETLLAAWQGLPGFGERASLRSWLYRIATNRCLNWCARLTPGDAVADDDTLAQVIAENPAIYGHPTSTVPMGGPGDPWALVDSAGAVNGLSALRVADASIIPDVPSSTTNVTVIMLAERIYQRAYAG